MTWTLAAIAALLIAYAALSGRLTRLEVSAAMFFTTGGLVVGPLLGLFDYALGSSEIKVLAEATLTLVLFSDASRLSLRELRGEYAVPLRLLGIGLPLTIAFGAIAGALVLPGFGIWEALVLAVMLACTDAALGQAVVSDERLPSRLRQGLNVESGLNDGICVPLFFTAVAIAGTQDGDLSARDALEIVARELGYGTLAGVVAGAAGALVLRGAWRRGWVEPSWAQILTAATALAAAGLARGLHGSIFIAAFVAGFFFGVVRHRVGGEVLHLTDQGGEVFNGVTFIAFGAVIVPAAWDALTWEVVLYAGLSLTVVRMAAVAFALLGTGTRPPTVLYAGWFGPRGLASIVFGVLLLAEAPLPHENMIIVAVTATVALSVYAHGLTATPLTERYVRWRAASPPPA